MGILILIVQVMALILANPMDKLGMQAVEDPQSTANSIYYIAIILLFTLFILIAIKKNIMWIIQLVILAAVASTLYYGFYPLLYLLGIGEIIAMIPSVFLALGLTVLLYKYPEWYVIDIIGVVIGAAASSIFGISFGIIPAIVLLGLLAIYDAISVYKTKHMIDLAEGIMDLKLPILFVIPKKKDYSFIEDKTTEEGEHKAYFMGLGDAIMPTVLVVSANIFTEYNGIISPAAAGAMFGTLTGYIALMVLVMRGKPQAGLPFLNTGAIAGYFIGALIAGMPLLG
nr:presenilin family intramembrane aspartyl protease PSH [Methanohalophilus sp.]